MEEQVNPLEIDHCLSVVLPGGQEKSATVHGSKPVMDLLVTLCASYHLNPSDYTVEVLSPNKNNISFKPNSPIGSLEAEKIVLKPKVVEEKIIKRPYMPEASVRLLINYNKSHKAVVRVSPRVPLEMLLPVVCDKCEFQVETTILLRDAQSEELLDLSKSLNEHGLREVFARDTAWRTPAELRARTPESAVTPTEVISPPPPQELPKGEKKRKENVGFLSLFRRGKKKPETKGLENVPASPGLGKDGGLNGQASVAPQAELPKKRRAPQPPMGASRSVPGNLGTCHLRSPQRSAESTLRSTKRRAPPPPGSPTPQQQQQQDPDPDSEAKDRLRAVEELRESDDESDSVNLSLSSSSSPRPSQPRSSSSSSRPSFSHLHELADPYLPSFRGRDLSDARSALAKVLTSSVSKGALVKRLRSSTTFPKFHSGSSSSFSFMPARCSDHGAPYAEPEPVLTSSLPTEREWEDPLSRKGTTTFKVSPSPKPLDPALSLDVPGQISREADPDGAAPQAEEPPPSPERAPESEEPCPPEAPHASPASPPATAEAEELEQLWDQDSAPSEVEAAQKEEEEVVLPEDTPAELSDHSDGELPCDGGNISDQSEAPVSPGTQSPAHTDEREAEEEEDKGAEEVVEEEEHKEEAKAAHKEEVGEEHKEEVGEGHKEEVGEEHKEEVGEEHQEEELGEEPEEEVVVLEGEEEEDGFPPPPSPIFFDEDEEESEAAASRRQSTALADLPTAAARPPEKSSSGPSRFAQAVALAVQRSRLQSRSRNPQPPPGGALPSPPRSMYQFSA